MTEEKIKGALARVSAEGVPSVSVSGGKCVLTYDAAHYEKRVSADLGALASVVAITSSSVSETLARAVAGAAAPRALAQTVTLSIRPLPEKK